MNLEIANRKFFDLIFFKSGYKFTICSTVRIKRIPVLLKAGNCTVCPVSNIFSNVVGF